MKTYLSIAGVVFTLLTLGSFFGCQSNPEAPEPTPTLVCDITMGNPADNDDNGFVGGYLLAASEVMASDKTIYRIGVKLSSATNFACAIYDDNNGEPNNMLAESGVIAGTAGWNEATIPATALTNGNTYWIVAISENTGIRDQDNVGSNMRLTYSWPTVAGSGMPTEQTGWVSGAFEMKLYGVTCQ